jgi:hypothetical protein
LNPRLDRPQAPRHGAPPGKLDRRRESPRPNQLLQRGAAADAGEPFNLSKSDKPIGWLADMRRLSLFALDHHLPYLHLCWSVQDVHGCIIAPPWVAIASGVCRIWWKGVNSQSVDFWSILPYTYHASEIRVIDSGQFWSILGC